MTAPRSVDNHQASDHGSAQAELSRLHRLYTVLSRINRTIIRATDQQSLFDAACRIAVEDGEFALAWIGLVDAGGLVMPVARNGAAAAAIKPGIATTDDAPLGRGPAGRALRDGKPRVENDSLAASDMEPWRPMLETWNLRAVAAFPLREDERVVGILVVAANEAGFFRAAETQLMVEVADDISFALGNMRREERRLAAESRLRFIAYHDPQTGLPARSLFDERLATECAAAPEAEQAVAVVYLHRYHDLVRIFGGAAGIGAAREVARRLEVSSPDHDVARIAEAAFALRLDPRRGLHLVEEAAWRIHGVVAQGIEFEGQELFVDPFIGIAIHPQHGRPETLVDHALLAASRVLPEGDGFCRFFSSEMEHGSRHAMSLDAALRHALEHDEFVLYYQPQANLRDGRLTGAEALVRWERPGHGTVSPDAFLPALESSGLIGPVGAWALNEACQRNRQWQSEGLPPLRIAVNLSARQFGNGMARMVGDALSGSGLDARWLELELTESIVLLDTEKVIRLMHELNGSGITHALDDFGTGYSSLSYLQRLPVARIKIDRSFITDITSNPKSAAIARAIVGMAHSLNLAVVAEGVENQGQANFLDQLGCEEMQGHHFSQALPHHDFANLLREGRCLAARADGLAPRTLLLVDDDPSILAALRRTFRREGWTVLAASHVQEAFDLLATHAVGVVVCDQRMPEMTGTEFLRRTKELHPATLRIVLTGYTELNSVMDAVNRGAIFRFLTKPWDDDILLAAIRDAFRLHEMERDNRDLTRRLDEADRRGALLPATASIC